MSNEDQWRWADPTGQQRLVRTDELRAALASGAIPPNAPVWRHGWKDWQSAQDVPELQTSALSAQNGVLPNIPPPPMFVVAAQSEFEGQPQVHATEPPPPPRYAAVAPSPKPVPVAPKPAGSSSRVTTVRPAPSPSKGPPPLARETKPTTKPAPPVTAKPKTPAPAKATVVGVPSLTTTLKSAPQPKPVPLAPATLTELDWSEASIAPEANTVVNHEVTDELAALAAAPSPPPAPAAKRITTPVNMPAPPPRTLSQQPPPLPPAKPQSVPPPKPQSIPPPKNPTLMLWGGAPGENRSSEPPTPIVVPPPEPSEATKNAVTRPPPWFEGAAEVQPAIPKQASMPRALPDAAEELSGSVLLPDQSGDVLPHRPTEQLSSSDLSSESSISVVKPAPLSPSIPAVARPHTLMGMAPAAAKPEPPALAPEPRGSPTLPPTSRKSVSVPPPRRDEQSPALSHDLSAILRSRPRWQLAVGGGVGLMVLLGLFGIVVHAASGPSTKPVASASASAPIASSVAASSAPPPVASSAAVAVPAAPKLASCSTSGTSHVMAPKGVVASGVEASVTAAGVSLGFATSPKDGLVLIVDPASMSVSQPLKVHSLEPIKRVQIGPGAKPVAVFDVDTKGDELQGRRTLVGSSSRIDVGSQGGGLVYAQPGQSDKTIRLFDLPSDAPVEALRGDPMPQGGFVLAFRQGKSVAFGTIVGDPPAPKGTLAHVDAKGSQVGSPSVAVGDGVALVAWAEKTDSWMVRLARFVPGEPPDAPVAFDMPPGGLGEQALSPSLASLPGGGSFLLVWTEGPTANHQVRAIVLDGHARPLGSALTVSEPGVNAGQPQAGVADGGKGVIGFLASAGGSKVYQVVATPIECVVK